MQQLIRLTFYIFLGILATTTCLILLGIGYLWFFAPENIKKDGLPYLEMLLTTVILEIVGVVIAFVYKGIKYLPRVEINKEEKETLIFMKNFISTGTSVTICSNRISWLAKSKELIETIRSNVAEGTLYEIILPTDVSPDIRVELESLGVNFYITQNGPPEARFTLINANRMGAEKLAIARGVHPNHEITIFDNDSGPQIIAMAKDIIRKSKELSKCLKNGMKPQTHEEDK